MANFDLTRFKTAQDPVFETALGELRRGRKQTHWMWFVFPQLRGLGRSPTAQFYGIASLAEARAYLADPVLHDRLNLATDAVLQTDTISLYALFGSPDDQKFHSSMTLFAIANGTAGSVFQQALHRFFNDQQDSGTVDLLRK